LWVAPDNPTAVVVDWKFYRVAPKRETLTPQLVCLAIMALDTYPHLEQVSCYAYSVRARDKFHFTLRRNAVEGDEKPQAEAFRETIIDIIKKCLEPYAKRIVGEEQCRFCKAAAYCNPHRKWVEKKAKKGTRALVVLDRQATPSKAADVLEAEVVCRQYLVAAEKFRKQALAVGLEIPGWEIQERAGNRAVVDPIGLHEQMAAENCNLEDLFECCSIAVTKLEKKFGSPQKFEEVCGPFIHRRGPSKRYVRRTDY
jgi:hypothetical protein